MKTIKNERDKKYTRHASKSSKPENRWTNGNKRIQTKLQFKPVEWEVNRKLGPGDLQEGRTGWKFI